MTKRIFFICLVVMCGIISVFAEDAKITAVKGKAEVQQNGSWIPAKIGDEIAAGTTVMTGFKSELTLKLGGSVIIVKPLTRLKIEEIVEKDKTLSSNVYLDMGAIKADIKPTDTTKKVDFKVKTPVATASVRGTSGLITADGLLIGETGQWNFSNIEGKSTLVNSGDIVTINTQGIIIPSQNTVMQNSKENAILTLAEREKVVQTLVFDKYIDTQIQEDNIVNPNPNPKPNDMEPKKTNETIEIDISWGD